MKIGVLALQGDFAKHAEALERLGVQARQVRLPEQVDGLDGLIIPGGESTTVGKLMGRFGLDQAIIAEAADGMAVFGTCAGMILLADRIDGGELPTLGLMDIVVRRNAFGRQVDSFEADIPVPEIDGEPVRAVFIRAPFVTEAGSAVQVMASLDDGRIVLVRQEKLLAAAFHPELTDDTRLHSYFLSMAEGRGRGT